MNKPYKTCLETMYGLRRFGIKLGLSTIRGILDSLGNPQDAYKCIHVAGTNGKGSTAAALSSILTNAGFKVGLYTSPHLVRFNERICVNGRQIADDDVVTAYHAIQSVHTGQREPTFFEFTTAMALYEFSRQKVDWAIVETGMGGRLDATNVVRPSACVITNISVEHREYLGDTVAQIAAEKAGIIKDCTPVVTAVRQNQALAVIRTIAADKKAPLYRLGEHFRCRRTGNGAFDYYGMDHTWRDLRPGLHGAYQTENAAMATAVCEVLLDAPDTQDNVRNGLAAVHWPGRLEIVSKEPLMILDGAHNRAAATNLATYLAQNMSGRDITMVIGILDDKPYAAMLKSLLPLCKRVILTRPKIERALPPETLAATARQLIQAVEVVPDVAGALRHALDTARPGEAICVAGSLYVVGEAKQWLESTAIAT